MADHLKRFGIIAALVLFAGTAAAQGTSLGWGQKPTPPQSGTSVQGQLKVGIVGGVNAADSTAQPMLFDASGSIKAYDPDRDRDFPVLTNLFNSVTLGVTTGHYQMGQAKFIGQYTRGAIHFRFSHAAETDSDSVAVAMRVWGRTAEQSGTFHLWTPQNGIVAADTCFWTGSIADSAGVNQLCPPTPMTWYVLRPRGRGAAMLAASGATKVPASMFGGTASTRASLRKIPYSSVKFCGPNGVVLNLVDNAGAPCPFSYIWVEVFNLSYTRVLNNVTADFWPRVQ